MPLTNRLKAQQSNYIERSSFGTKITCMGMRVIGIGVMGMGVMGMRVIGMGVMGVRVIGIGVMGMWG